jgi:hypothetical protein
MSTYQIYFVTTAKPKSGKSAVAAAWWNDKGKQLFGAMSGTKSVRAYIAQFGLTGEAFSLEIWQELECYATLDKWDEEARSDPNSYSAFLKDFHQFYDVGPCRLMGEWPNSQPT